MNPFIKRRCLLGSLLIGIVSTSLLANSESSNTEDPPSTQSASTDAVTLPSLSARHIRWHEPSDLELIRTDIALSPDGFRVRQAVQGDRHREMLQNFVDNEAWLIDHKRSIAHQLPLEDDARDDMLRPGDDASFLSTNPCGVLLTAESAGKGQWRGRAVDTWYCKNTDGETEAIELVDNVYGIVVYRRTAGGLIDELKNLQEREFADDYFRPDSALRRVDRHEFFGRVPNLKSFDEAQ